MYNHTSYTFSHKRLHFLLCIPSHSYLFLLSFGGIEKTACIARSNGFQSCGKTTYDLHHLQLLVLALQLHNLVSSKRMDQEFQCTFNIACGIGN
jgi:hypothetical protein